MSAVFQREFKTYFTSPIGYIVLAMMFGLSGYYFFLYNLSGKEQPVKLPEAMEDVWNGGGAADAVTLPPSGATVLYRA